MRLKSVKRIAILLVGVSLIVSAATTYGALGFMDTNEFCGQQCHEMRSRLQSLENPKTLAGSHYEIFEKNEKHRAEEACTSCHYKPGTINYVKTKLRSFTGEVYPHFFEKIDPAEIVGHVSNQICLKCHEIDNLKKRHKAQIEGNNCTNCHLTGHDDLLAFHRENRDVLNAMQIARIEGKDCSACHGEGPVNIHSEIEEDCSACHVRSVTRLHREIVENCVVCHGEGSTEIHEKVVEDCSACHYRD